MPATQPARGATNCVPGPNEPFKTRAPPSAMTDDVIPFCHLALNHIGTTRLRNAIAFHFCHPHLQLRAERAAHPRDACQRHKLTGRGGGRLAARAALLAPWQEVAVNLIGPWSVNLPSQELKFKALTGIDAVSNCPEMTHINNETSLRVAQQFENSWLSRHPRPMQCARNQGSEFTGHEPRTALDKHDVTH